MVMCAVFGCLSNNNKKLKINQDNNSDKVKFFRFPKDENIMKIWINKCQRVDKFNTKNSSVCSKHFTPEHYLRNLRHELLQYSPKNSKKLKVDAIPTENLPSKCPVVEIQSNTERSNRIKKRNMKFVVHDLLELDKKKHLDEEIVELPTVSDKCPVVEIPTENLPSKCPVVEIQSNTERSNRIKKRKFVVHDLLELDKKKHLDEEIVELPTVSDKCPVVEIPTENLPSKCPVVEIQSNTERSNRIKKRKFVVHDLLELDKKKHLDEEIVELPTVSDKCDKSTDTADLVAASEININILLKQNKELRKKIFELEARKK